MFPEVEPRGTLRFESLSNLLYSKTETEFCLFVQLLLFFFFSRLSTFLAHTKASVSTKTTARCLVTKHTQLLVVY